MCDRPVCSVCGCEIDEGNYGTKAKPVCQPCHFVETDYEEPEEDDGQWPFTPSNPFGEKDG